MTVSNVSWYLCVLFAVALALSSAVTVAPQAQTRMRLEMAIWLALSSGFAAVAIIFRWWRVGHRKWLLRLFQCFALLATLVVLMMAIG